jgi:probable HAF family extracellular repeat protein
LPLKVPPAASVTASREALSTTRALWNRSALTDLGTLGGASSTVLPGDIIPEAINDRGQIAGVSQTTTGELHAFLWDRGVMMDLGKFPGREDAIGWAINNSGEMIGTFQYLSGNCAVDHVFYWSKGVMTDLPTIQTGAGSECPTNWPDGINNTGQIVGMSDGHAVLWQRSPKAVP